MPESAQFNPAQAAADEAHAPAVRGPILIVGYGSIGRRHVRNLQSLGCDSFVFHRTRQGTVPDEDTARWPSTNDLSEALSHGPRLAIISNPTSLHMQTALAAAAAGCHLLIEKPVSHSLDGCQELARLVAEQDLTVMVGCQFRFHPLLIRLRDELRAGRLGRVIGARAEWGEYLPDWHPWEDHRCGYSARSDLGGGVILTLIHPLDYLFWLFGPATQVAARTRRVPILETPAGEDWAEITLTFTDDLIAQVHLDYVQRPPVHRLSVVGERGRALWDFHAGALAWEMHNTPTAVERVPDGFDRNDMFLTEMREFLVCVDRRGPTSIPLADGVAVLELALAARREASEK